MKTRRNDLTAMVTGYTKVKDLVAANARRYFDCKHERNVVWDLGKGAAEEEGGRGRGTGGD